jgi:hypothetical protein
MSYQPYDRNAAGIVYFGTSVSDQVYESLSTFTFDGTNKLSLPDGGYIGSQSQDDALQIASDGDLTTIANLTVGGNLVVNGTTTTVNSTTVTIDDPIFTLGGDTAPGSDDNKDRGIEFRYHNGSTAKLGFFGFDDSTGKFTFIPDATNSSEVFSGTAGTIVANLEGNVTGDVTGNADTATTLATARNFSITGEVTASAVSFDGSDVVALAASLDATAITGQTAETSIADDDLILIYDTSNTALRKMTKANFVSGLAGGGGDITGVTAGAGLTGGGDSGGVTVNVVGGDGITANADEIEVTVDDSTIELSASDGSGSVRIKDLGVSTAKLAADAVTGAKIADNAIDSEHYTDGSIDTAHIGDDQVTYAKIQNVSATNRILGRDSAGAGVIEEISPASLRTMINVEDGATADQTKADIDGLAITTVGTLDTGDATAIVSAASTTAAGKVELATTAETTTGTDATRAVTPDGLKDGYQGSTNVTTLGTISTGTWNGTAIAQAYIAGDAINGSKIADDSIDSEHYVDGSIDTAHIGDLQVTTAKIAADAITGAKIADDTINSEHYVAGSIDNEHLADNAVNSDEIADGAVDEVHRTRSVATPSTSVTLSSDINLCTGTITVTMPTGADGKMVVVKNVGTGVVTIAATPNIDGSSGDHILYHKNEVATLVYGNSQWNII